MIRFTLFGGFDLRGPTSAERLPGQPKLIGVLVYLLLAGPARFLHRDRLTGTFWPDQPDRRARGSLRNALYELREALGQGVIVTRGDDEVGIDRATIDCDLFAFEEAIEKGELARALELYRGELLSGFQATDAGFEQWLETTRHRYRALAADTAWALASRSETATDLTSATRWARQAARLAGADERRIRRVLTLLVRAGDRAGAVAVYEEFERYLARALRMSPDAETAELAAKIREGWRPA